jgi:hypothetical protein
MADFSPSDELALLRRYEPIIRFTRGERFFPMDVDRYINECSLWMQRPKEPPELVIPQGEMTIDRLTQVRQGEFGTVYYLKFIDPLDLIELARYSLQEVVKQVFHSDEKDTFHAGRGRLARVGYVSRFLDALFSLTLLMRGRVPGDTSAAAALTYHRIQQQQESYSYYGRVVRQNSWVVLQYWFFYPFNNWRSGFFGVNDHEADWEMISIYCSDHKEGEASPRYEAERLRPVWVAYASHDYSGDDLRRHWDDPELEKAGNHPVIYAGAGSHASYYRPGEYLAELELHFLNPLVRIGERIRRVWSDTLRQSINQDRRPGFHVFSIPFVDYARGDGITIGPGQTRTWEPSALNPVPGWVKYYRGLWGLYARDPVAGENAPAGPMYNRDGSVRLSWFDPLAWAGLDKVPPPDEALDILDLQRSTIMERRIQLESEADKKSQDLFALGLETTAMEGFPYMEALYQRNRARLQALSTEVVSLRREITFLDARLEAYNHHETRLLSGQTAAGLRSHINRAHLPSSEVDLRLGFLAEIFSSISIGLLMVSLVALIVFAREYLLFGLVAMVGLLVFIESGFRRQLTRLVTSMTVGLAVVNAIVLLFVFFWQLVIAGVILAGLYIIWENIKEIRR